MSDKLLKFLVLPSHISEFEHNYLGRLNRIALWFFVAHLPAFLLIAALNDQSVLGALLLTALVLAGPVLAYRTLSNPRSVSLVYGFSSMLMGGLLVMPLIVGVTALEFLVAFLQAYVFAMLTCVYLNDALGEAH